MSRTAQDPVVLYVRVSVMEGKAGHKKQKESPVQIKKKKATSPKLCEARRGIVSPGTEWGGKAGQDSFVER